MGNRAITEPLALTTDYVSIDGRYTDANGNPYASVAAAETALGRRMNQYTVGLTVLVKESGWNEAKEYWVQPKGTTPETYGLVPKSVNLTTKTELSKEEKYYASANVSDRPAYVVIETGVVRSLGYRVLSPNLSFAEQVSGVNNANMIFEIKDSFDLGGGSVTIPSGCTLKFEGGSLKDGVLNGSYTVIQASPVKIFDEIEIGGTWSIDGWLVEWFGADAFVAANSNYATVAIQSAVDAAVSTKVKSVIFQPKSYYVNGTIIINGGCEIKGAEDIKQSTAITKILTDVVQTCFKIEYESSFTVNIKNIYFTSNSYYTKDAIVCEGNGTAFPQIVLEQVYGYLMRYGLWVKDNNQSLVRVQTNQCSFTQCVIGVYIDCKSDAEAATNAWINACRFRNTILSRNKVGGIYIKDARNLLNVVVEGCDIEGNGSNYDSTLYGTFGCFGVKLETARSLTSISGANIIRDTYFEGNYPHRSGSSSDVGRGEYYLNDDIMPTGWCSNADCSHIVCKKHILTIDNCIFTQSYSALSLKEGFKVNFINNSLILDTAFEAGMVYKPIALLSGDGDDETDNPAYLSTNSLTIRDNAIVPWTAGSGNNGFTLTPFRVLLEDTQTSIPESFYNTRIETNDLVFHHKKVLKGAYLVDGSGNNRSKVTGVVEGEELNSLANIFVNIYYADYLPTDSVDVKITADVKSTFSAASQSQFYFDDQWPNMHFGSESSTPKTISIGGNNGCLVLNSNSVVFKNLIFDYSFYSTDDTAGFHITEHCSEVRFENCTFNIGSNCKAKALFFDDSSLKAQTKIKFLNSSLNVDGLGDSDTYPIVSSAIGASGIRFELVNCDFHKLNVPFIGPSDAAQIGLNNYMIGDMIYRGAKKKPAFWASSGWTYADGASIYANHKGTAANRPDATLIGEGFIYFDTTIGKPIFWNGSSWTDANGETVGLQVSDTTVLIGAAADSYVTLNVYHANALTVSALNPDNTPATSWLTVPADIAVGTNSLTISAAENTASNPRGAKVIISDGTDVVIVNVVQNYATT